MILRALWNKKWSLVILKWLPAVGLTLWGGEGGVSNWLSYVQSIVLSNVLSCGTHKLVKVYKNSMFQKLVVTISWMYCACMNILIQYPFSVRDPTQLAHPVRVVSGLTYPCGIAFNSKREMIVSEYRINHRIVVLDIKRDMIRTFGSEGYSLVFMWGYSLYVSSRHKLQKFTSSGELIKCVGMVCSEPGGVTL